MASPKAADPDAHHSFHRSDSSPLRILSNADSCHCPIKVILNGVPALSFPDPKATPMRQYCCILSTLICAFIVALLISGSSVQAEDVSRISFEHDVRPLLTRHCDRCHGTRNQEADLQLNLRSSVMHRGTDAEPIIVPGQPDQSLLIQRLTASDAGDSMPLDSKPLTSREIDVLRRWIEQGASWPDEFAEDRHWAWTPVTRPALPDPESATAAIDHFVRRRLNAQSIEPTEPLDRPRLLRRVSLALTGLPPTAAEIDAFVNDTSSDAYARVVDRLLASPRYGERWAVPWMDLARYADSNGFQADQLRDNWAWRDWVIRAFNSDMPFDTFVIDQLAGDLRPDATLDQKIATGFHRMTTCNVEAGVHPEANRVNQIVDRVNTTATAFLGVTMECAQCHDHKYDPFTQEDYYRLFAYFNNSPLEVKNTKGVTWDFYGPSMKLPLEENRQQQKQELQQQIKTLREQHAQIQDQNKAQYEAWLASLRDYSPSNAWNIVPPESFVSSGEDTYAVQEDGSVLLSGPTSDTASHTLIIPLPDQPVTALRLETLADESLPGSGPGRAGGSKPDVQLQDIQCVILRDNEVTVPVTIRVAQADHSATGHHISAAIDGDPSTSWSIAPQYGKPHQARFEFAEPVIREQPQDRLQITLVQGRSSIGRPRLSLATADPATLDIDQALVSAAQAEQASKEQQQQLRREFEERHPQLSVLNADMAALRSEFKAIQPDTTLVMVEMDEPRETFILTRGDYEQPADKVAPGTPHSLPAATNIPATGDRLELARWLTSPDNPLLARVTVNRWWAELFGTGLVATPEDFGTQADTPSHPQLLDWLAAEFISSGWSMKHIHRLIVLSETWQQDAAGSSRIRAQDPHNRLLARGPRFRLPAEIIRDNALAVSGLLSVRMYGAPVMPWQPQGVWRSVGRNQPKWVSADDEDRFRRGVYVICKRAAPYPSFTAFDAPDRGSCTVNRSRSNTPLQALTLLNDRAYGEMALAFADRILCDTNEAADAERIAYAMQLATARRPRDQETSVLLQLLQSERNRLAEQPEQVEARLSMQAPGTSLQWNDQVEIAAWFAIANTLLNLDETMTQ